MPGWESVNVLSPAVCVIAEPDETPLTSKSSAFPAVPGEEGVIYAESRLIKDGRTCCTYEINVTDDKGVLLAVVNVNGVHAPKV